MEQKKVIIIGSTMALIGLASAIYFWKKNKSIETKITNEKMGIKELPEKTITEKISAIFTPKIDTGATEGGLPDWVRPAPISKDRVDMDKRVEFLLNENKK
jgi:hypothetical protein